MTYTKMILTIDQMEAEAKCLRDSGKKIVTTNGCYDLLHAGHIDFLEKSQKLGDVLVLLINSDASVTRLKGSKRPIVSEKNRAKLVASLKFVDYVVIFPHEKPLEYLGRIKGHIHTKGGSWIPERLNEEIEFVSRWGGDHKTFLIEPGFSTTELIESIRQKHALVPN